MDDTTKKHIQEMISAQKVFLFMKGTPENPQCGFSWRVVKVLKDLGVNFGSCNVLANPSIREGIKEFTNWPTIPQLYINGKFVGGCEITEQLAASGELKKLLA